MSATLAMRRLFVCCLTCFLAGCSAKSDLGRLPLHGKLSIASIPAEQLNGSISLLPLKNTNGPAANASIRQGTYRFTPETGPVPGKYRAIVALLPGGSKMDALPSKRSQQSQAVPKPGTSRSNWTFEVEVAAETLERDFAVDKLSAPEKPREKSVSRP